MICRDVKSATRQAVWKEFVKRDIKPSAVIEAANTELIKRLVASGRGVSLLSEVCVKKEIERGERWPPYPLLKGLSSSISTRSI